MKGVNGKEVGFDVMREQRLALILQMHVSGASYRAIATHLKKLVEEGQPQKNVLGQITGVWRAPAEWDIGHVQVGNEIKEALREARKENRRTAEEARTLRGLRLQQLMLGVWPKAVQGDVGAGWLALAIDDRIAQNEGTDKPKENKPQRVIFSIEDNGIAPGTNQAAGAAPQPAED